MCLFLGSVLERCDLVTESIAATLGLDLATGHRTNAAFDAVAQFADAESGVFAGTFEVVQTVCEVFVHGCLYSTLSRERIKTFRRQQYPSRDGRRSDRVAIPASRVHNRAVDPGFRTLNRLHGKEFTMFDRRSVPTPFPVGDVNTYLANRTIVDPGPDSDDAWTVVRSFLADHDLEPADVERVVLTHAHADHFGLAKRFRDRGASVIASPGTAAIIEDFDANLEDQSAFIRELLPAHGMNPGAAATLSDLSSNLRSYGPDCTVDRRLSAADSVAIGSTPLSVQRVSGHAEDELILSYEVDATVDRSADSNADDRLGTDGGAGTTAIVGDHVLGHITPNPVLRPPSQAEGARPRPLLEFNTSLPALRERGFDRLLPGHGDVVRDPAERIAEILSFHEDRTDTVAAILEDRGEATAFEVMAGLFGDLPLADQFMGMSEAISHLDVLEDRDRVRRDESGDCITYELTD